MKYKGPHLFFNIHGIIRTPMKEDQEFPYMLSLWTIFIHTSSFLTRSRTIDFAPVEYVEVSPANIETNPFPLCTIWHLTTFPAWLRMDAQNRYKPGTGALKIPVKESNPNTNVCYNFRKLSSLVHSHIHLVIRCNSCESDPSDVRGNARGFICADK